MSYLSALTNAAAPLGNAPKVPHKSIGTPPPPTHADVLRAQQSAEPPAYDVTKDANWQGIVHPEDHQLQGVLNNMSPEDRQVLQTRLQQLIQAATGPKMPGQPGGAPPMPQPPNMTQQAVPPQAPPNI